MANRYDAEITDLKRRLSNGVIIGTISEVDAEKWRYRVKAGLLESDWLPMAVRRAGKTTEYTSYDKGEQVILAAPSGDLSQAVILGAIAVQDTQAADKANIHRIKYPDGTVVEYDDEEKRYKMTVAEGGGFELTIGGGASIVGSGTGLKLKAADIEFESNTLTHNGVDISEHHVHTDVLQGGDLSGPPFGGD